MSNRKIIYRPVIYLLSLFYMVFFLLSPYSHHHHTENVTEEKPKELTHLHPFGDNHNTKHQEHSDHEFDDDENRCQQLKSSNLNFLKVKGSKFLSGTITFSHFSLSNYSNSLSYSISSSPGDFSKLLWEKYVHSASNNSPPLT